MAIVAIQKYMENIDEIKEMFNFRNSATSDTGDPYAIWSHFLKASRRRISPYWRH